MLKQQDTSLKSIHLSYEVNKMVINNNINKKAAVGDSIIGFAALLVVILVSGVVALMLFEFNEGIQALPDDIVTPDGKEVSAYAVANYTPLMNYAFLFGLIGFILYSIVTSVLISKINPVFWVVGVVMSLAATIIFSVLKYIYGALRTVDMLGVFISAIPGANMIMSNIELVGTIWIFIQFTLMYKFREA